MPKLNTTIDNLEWKSNKVTGSVPSSSWTDAQYPSAKTLYNAYNKLINIAHPIGSILITATNTNPASTIGGTWVLVDKAFKFAYFDAALNEADFWTNTNASLKQYSNILINDHEISLRLNIWLDIQLDDSELELGKLNVAACGITEFSHTIFSDVSISDGGNCTVAYKLSQDGTISVLEVLNLDGTHSMDSGQNFYINLVQPIYHTKMIDSFCDKFYWKRTA